MAELPWDDSELLRSLYWDEGLSYADIAERWTDATRDKIRWQFKKHDIETRTRGEGKRLKTKSIVSVSEIRGRYRLEFREFGEHRQFPLARLMILVDHTVDEVAGHHVHHINGCSLDDRPDNLELRTPTEHKRHHAPSQPFTREQAKMGAMANDVERDPDTGRFVSKD